VRPVLGTRDALGMLFYLKKKRSRSYLFAFLSHFFFFSGMFLFASQYGKIGLFFFFPLLILFLSMTEFGLDLVKHALFQSNDDESNKKVLTNLFFFNLFSLMWFF